MRFISNLLFFVLIAFFLNFENSYSVEKTQYQNQKIQNISQLYQQSDSLYSINDIKTCNKLCEQTLESIIYNYKKTSQEAVFGMYKLALCEFELGNYQKADSLISEAIQVQNKIDSTSLMSGRLWYKKSEIGNILCDCKAIIPIAEKAVTLLENSLGKNHEEVAEALDIYGYVLAHELRYEEAIEVHHRALKIFEDNFGDKSTKICGSLNYLSRIYLIQYDYENGMPYIERALSVNIDEDLNALQRLSDTYFFKTYFFFVMSDYEAAQETAIKSVELAVKSYGENHPKTAEYSAILSRIYLMLGKYELAEPLMLHIKDIYDKTFNPQNPVMYYSYINLGELYISQGRYDEAEYYFSQSLNRPNVKESFRAGVLPNLAKIYFELGEYKKAEELSNEVIPFRTKQFNNKHASVALSLKLLAKIYTKQNKFITAKNTYLKILDVFQKNYGDNSLYVASTLYDMAQLYTTYNMPKKAEECLTKTIEIRTKTLLVGHPLVAHSYLDLAVNQISLNKIDSSFENILKGLNDRREFMTHVFQYSSSEQKLLYIKDNPLIYDPLLYLADKYKSDKMIESACEMILYGKAYVIDALSVDKAISVCEDDEEISLLVGKYSDICTRISALALSTRQDVIDLEEGNKLENLYKTRDSLEAALSMNCATFNISNKQERITLQSIASVLDESTIYIDYIKYHPIINDNTKTNYLAYALDNKIEVSLFDLGDAEEIDKLIFDARNQIQESRYQIFSKNSIYLEEELKKTTNKLYHLLIKPFNSRLTGKQKIIIAPDSDLNLIPFEIFTNDDNEYLIENYEICYLSSGRDLIHNNIEYAETRGLIVVASPDFDSKNNSQKFIQPSNVTKKHNTKLSPSRAMDSQTNCFESAFTQLSYSRIEGQQLVDLFNEKYTDESATLYFDKEATTLILANLQDAPRYVHLSTHGFFCQDDDKMYIKNPLLRSGLAFTGANYSIVGDAKTPYTFDDGLLTALEVTGLNLFGTELVTLSACETGIGETVQGEGVFGLRRAFQIAGAKSILMSMWKIPDKETSDLMSRFYSKLFFGSTKQKALRKSALEILKESREKNNHGHPYLWGGFILTGNPN